MCKGGEVEKWPHWQECRCGCVLGHVMHFLSIALPGSTDQFVQGPNNHKFKELPLASFPNSPRCISPHAK